MNSRTSAIAVVLVAAIAVAAAGIWQRAGGDEAADAAARSSERLANGPAEPLPAPRSRTVLRIGGVAQGNTGAHTTKVDFATLDRLARERLTVREPFLKREVTFTGVRMSELLRRAGVAPSARNLYVHALDDYHVELPVAAVASEGLLATRADGEPIAIAKGGPIRLVFAAGGELAGNTDNWIWSIDSMRALR